MNTKGTGCRPEGRLYRRAIPGLLLCLVLPCAARAQSAPTAPPARVTAEWTDDLGRHVAVPQPVRRIVSLAPSVTETLYALGAGERLAGDTDYCDYPAEAKTKPHVGGAVNPSLEQVVALKPDLVVATKTLNRRETVDALERLGIAAYVTDARTVEQMIGSTERLGAAIGAEEKGAALASALRARLEALHKRLEGLPPRRVLFVVWHEPLVTVGRDTFLADALRKAGAESIVESAQDWPHESLEDVVRLQPEYLVFASSHSEEGERTFEAIRDKPGWRNLHAVRERKIAVISDAINRPAPRMVDAIEELARQVHPEAFLEKGENRKEKIENRLPRMEGQPLFSVLFSLFVSVFAESGC